MRLVIALGFFVAAPELQRKPQRLGKILDRPLAGASGERGIEELYFYTRYFRVFLLVKRVRGEQVAFRDFRLERGQADLCERPVRARGELREEILQLIGIPRILEKSPDDLIDIGRMRRGLDSTFDRFRSS